MVNPCTISVVNENAGTIGKFSIIAVNDRFYKSIIVGYVFVIQSIFTIPGGNDSLYLIF
jgi:hypothetical protein